MPHFLICNVGIELFHTAEVLCQMLELKGNIDDIIILCR